MAVRNASARPEYDCMYNCPGLARIGDSTASNREAANSWLGGTAALPGRTDYRKTPHDEYPALIFHLAVVSLTTPDIMCTQSAEKSAAHHVQCTSTAYEGVAPARHWARRLSTDSAMLWEAGGRWGGVASDRASASASEPCRRDGSAGNYIVYREHSASHGERRARAVSLHPWLI